MRGRRREKWASKRLLERLVEKPSRASGEDIHPLIQKYAEREEGGRVRGAITLGQGALCVRFNALNCRI